MNGENWRMSKCDLNCYLCGNVICKARNTSDFIIKWTSAGIIVICLIGYLITLSM